MRIETGIAGQRTYRTDWGTSVTVGKEGIVCELARFTRVGIADLTEVESHHITRIAGSVSHVVRFVGGGHVQFAYNNRGELIDLQGQSIRAWHQRDGDLLIGAYRPEAAGGRI